MKIGDEVIFPMQGKMTVAAVADIFESYEDAGVYWLAPWLSASEQWITCYGKRDGSEFWAGVYGTKWWTLEHFGERVAEIARNRK